MKLPHIPRVSLEEARAKALPVFMAGYLRRGRRRSESERGERADAKVERDDEHNVPPTLCPI